MIKHIHKFHIIKGLIPAYSKNLVIFCKCGESKMIKVEDIIK